MADLKVTCQHCGAVSTFRPVAETASTPKPKKEKSAQGAILNLLGDPEIEDFLSSVSQDTQLRWLKLYGDVEHISREILKAITWLKNNPKRQKKHLGRFMTNWLENNQRPFGAGKRLESDQPALTFQGKVTESL